MATYEAVEVAIHDIYGKRLVEFEILLNTKP